MEYRGNEEAAADFLGMAVAHAPTQELRSAHGNLLVRLRKFQDALVTLIPVLRDNPQHRQTLMLVCECLIEVGEFARAQSLIEKARNAGVSPPVVANLQQLLTTRRMGLGKASMVDHTMEESLIGDFDEVPGADSAYTYQEGNEPTEAFDVDAAIHDAFTSMSTNLGNHPSTPQNDLPTLAASVHEDLPTMMSPASFVLPSDEEPTKSFSRAEAMASLQAHQDQEDDESLYDATMNVSLERTSNASFVPADFIESHRSPPPGRPAPPQRPSPQRTNQAELSARTMRQDADAIPFETFGEPVEPAQQSAQDRSYSMLGNPEAARRFDMREQDYDEVSLEPDIFGDPEELFGLSGNEPPPPQNIHHVPGPSFGAQEAPQFGSQLPPQQQPYPQPQPTAPPSALRPGFSEESLELDLPQDHQLLHAQPHAPHPSARSPAHEPKPPRGPLPAGVKLLGALAVAAITMIVMLVVIAYVADSSLSSKVDERTLAAQTNMRLHSFSGLKAAYLQLKEAHTTSSFLGGELDSLLAGALPGLEGVKKKERLLGELAETSAYLEYMYGAPGDFQAAEHGEAASAALGEDAPQVRRAMAYRLMRRDPVAAYELTLAERERHPTDPRSLEAHLDALLELGRMELAWTESSALRAEETTSARQQMLLARLMSATHHAGASLAYGKALKLGGGEHLGAHMGLVEASLQEGEDATRSINILEDARQSDAGAPACYRALMATSLARHAMGDNDIKRARHLYLGARALCPARMDIALALIEFMALTGQRSAALKRLDALKDTSPHISLTHAKLALMSGEPQQALDLLQDIPQLFPERSRLQGYAALQMQDYARAQSYFEESAALDSARGEPAAMALYTRLLASPARADEIIKELDELVDRHKLSPHVLKANAQARALAARDADTKKRKNLEAQSDKRFSEALAASQQDAPIYYDRCAAIARRGQLERAMESCEEGYALASDYIPGAVLRAQVLSQMGEAAKAILALEELDSTTGAKSLTVRTALARALILSGQAEEANSMVSALQKEAPDDPRVTLLTGLHAFHLEQYIQAHDALNRAVKSAPTSIEASVFLAYAKVRLGKLDEAEAPLKKHLHAPIWGAYAWLALGELRRRQESFDDAEENLSTALDLFSNEHAPAWFITEAYLQRALAWSSDKGWKNDRVAQYLEQAAKEGDANHVGLNYVRGVHALSSGRPSHERAEVFFERALKQNPHHCPTLKALPVTLRKLSNPKRARELEAHAKSKSCS